MPEFERRCFGCMNLLTEETEACPVCGYPTDGSNPSEYLAIGALLGERYVVGRVLSFSGATACYIAYDTVGSCPVFLRELMPISLCHREKSGTLTPKEANFADFTELSEKFDNQSRTLAKLRDLSVLLPIYDLFKQNGTSYTVSEYIEPHTLTELLSQKGGRLTWNETRKLFLPFLSSLISCHTAGLKHLAICPQNLFVDETGRLRLMGFDLETVRREGTLIEPQLADGYAAPEQYTMSKTVGLSADVYAVAATLFRVLTGNPPPEGAHRAEDGNDLYMPAEVANALPEHVLETLADALHPNASSRISSLTELRDRLSTGRVVSALAQEAEEMTALRAAEDRLPAKSSGKKYGILIAVILVLLILAIGGIVYLKLWKPQNDTSTSSDVSQADKRTTVTEPTSTRNVNADSITPRVCGEDYYALVYKNNNYMFEDYPVKVIGFQYSDEAKAGYIVAQSPAEGEPIEKNGTIEVYLSAGKAQTAVPDVTGWKAEHAEIYLEALGFRVETSEGADTSVDVGCVFGTWPPAGTEPMNGNKVTLRVNNTPKPTEAADSDTSDDTSDSNDSGEDDTEEDDVYEEEE